MEVVMTSTKTGIEEAVLAAGSQSNLARRLGVSQQFISTCLRRGYVPTRRAVEIEAQFGVPRKRLLNPRLVDLVDLGTCG